MSQKRYIYLAGPIGGCDKAEANDWRNNVSLEFNDGIVGISPLRCEPLDKPTYSIENYDKRWCNPGAISSKNLLDTQGCDLVLAYMPKNLNDRRPSYGTVMEIAWTMMLNKPLIIVSDDDYLKTHPLISHNTGWLLDDLSEAVEVINGLFTEYVGIKNTTPDYKG
jgi:nucleoside 2-deoxyribosyltransferase